MGIFPFQTFCSEFSRLICSSLQDDYEYFLLTCSIFLNERGRDSERNGTSVERFSFRVRFFFEIFATQPLRRCVAAAQTSSSPTLLVNSPPHQGFRQKKFYGSRLRQKASLLSWKHQCSVPFVFSSTEECLRPCKRITLYDLKPDSNGSS